MSRRVHSGRRDRVEGVTLVELLVALLLGLGLVASMLAAQLAASRSARVSDALMQVTADATQALSLIRAQVAMAGFSMPRAVTDEATGQVGNGAARQPPAEPAIFGCAGADFSPLSLPARISEGVACGGSASGSDTLEVSYEVSSGADGGAPSNALLNADGLPLDCLGSAIPAETGVSPALYVNDSKFYVEARAHPGQPTLNCFAHGARAGAALVDHVERLAVTYGLAEADGPADQVRSYTVAPQGEAWQRVLSVTVCVQVRSARRIDPTGSAATLGDFLDCNQRPQTSADGYLRRSFTTTIALQNRLP